MTKLFHAANIQVFRELVSIYITDCYTIITESSCLLGVSLLCEQTLFLFSYLEINFVADVRNQTRSVFFFYYTRSFIVLIEMHSGAHTHIQYFQRKLVGYSFLIDPEADRNISYKIYF